MRRDFDQPLSALGALLATYTVGYLVGSAGAGRVARRLGAGQSLVAAGALGAVGIGAYAAGPAWPVLVVAAPLVGVFGGLLDALLNAHVAVHHSTRALNLLHAAFGLGATLSPLLLTAVLTAGATWRLGYVLVLLAELAVWAAFWRTREQWRAAPDDPDLLPTAPAPRVAVLLSAAVFFAYVGVEASAGQWSFTFLTEERGLGRGVAGVAVATYWASLTAGRVVAGLLAARVTPAALLQASFAGVGVGTLLLWWSPVAVAGPVGLALTGLGLAAVFPTLVGLTPGRVGAGDARRVIGLEVAAAALGGGVIPAAIGIVLDRAGVAALGPALVVTAVVVVVLYAALDRVAPVRLPSLEA